MRRNRASEESIQAGQRERNVDKTSWKSADRFRSLWHPNSKGPVPSGAIYLRMGTGPNPACTQFLHYGEQDSGSTSTHLPSLGLHRKGSRQPFYPAAHITGSHSAKARMKIHSYTLCRGWEAQKEAQTNAGVGRSWRMRSSVPALVSNKTQCNPSSC